MRTKNLVLLSLFVGLSLFLTACSGQSLASTDAPGLTVHNETAYISGGMFVYAVDLATGKELTYNNNGTTEPLRFPIEGNDTFYGDPAFTEDGKMVVGSSNINDRNHSLYLSDAETFVIEPNWPLTKQSKDTWMAGAVVLDGIIYIPNSDGNLYAFKADGTPEGYFKTNSAIWSSPVSDGETIYVSSMDHFVYAIDPANIEKAKWQADLLASVIGAPVVADGKLYVGTLAGDVFALDAATGDILWKSTVGGIISDHVAVANGRVFVGVSLQGVGKVYILNTEDGAVITQVDTTGNVVASPLATETLVVFVTETGLVQAIDFDGKPIWQDQILDERSKPIKVYSNPVAAGDTILVAPFGNSSNMLIAYDTNGAKKWTFAPSK